MGFQLPFPQLVIAGFQPSTVLIILQVDLLQVDVQFFLGLCILVEREMGLPCGISWDLQNSMFMESSSIFITSPSKLAYIDMGFLENGCLPGKWKLDETW